MSKILLKNIYCLMTSPYEQSKNNVDLLIEENIIKEIGENLEDKVDKSKDRIVDCSTLVVIPGLVNTHHHFYQTLTRNLPAVQNAKLFDWLIYLYEIWKYIEEDEIYYSSLTAISELLKSGCTLSTDHHYLYPKKLKDKNLDVMGIQFRAAKTLGIRFSPTRGSMSLSKKDGGLPPDSVVQTVDEILTDSERCIKMYHDTSDFSMNKIVLAPCSPFSVTEECMIETVKLARKNKVKLHTHLCETIDEENDCKKNFGIRPLALMERCGLIGEDVFYAHGIWFNDEELDILAKTHTSIAHCPSSNMRLGSGICRVKEMLEKNICVGIAVDGSASNDSSNLLLEAKQALYLQRVRYGANALTSRDVFKMACENGAKMLGYNKIGRLELGYGADIAIFDVNTVDFAGSHSDPIAALLFCMTPKAKFTIVNGKIVVDNYEVVGLKEIGGEEELVLKHNACANKLLNQ